MFDRAGLKREVRNIIQGQWFRIFLVGFLVSLIITLPMMLIYGMSVAPALIAYGPNGMEAWAESANPFVMLGMSGIIFVYAILISPLSTSLCGYYVKIARRQPATLGDALSGFQHMGPFIATMLWTVLWAMIWLLPFIVLYSVGLGLLTTGYPTIIGVVLLIASLAAYVYALIRVMLYSMAPYAIWENPEIGASGALNESKRLMMGHRWEYFVLSLSFILWDLLASITCGIAYIYVMPYESVTYAAYYDYLRGMNYRETPGIETT